MHLLLEMSISRQDFLRLLPGAVGEPALHETDGTFSGSDGARRWTVRLSPLPVRRLGSFALERHRIELRLEGYREAEEAAFLAKFHRGFQRGGG